jgi:glycosyltransferase involved in cell wall biosynthesis
VYNSQKHIRDSLDSLLAQTYADFTLIVSDNASDDSTSEICQEYARRDARIRYYRNDVNIGLPGNFNRVAELCTTPFLKWSTADDYWAPTMLEKTMAVIEADASIALCYPKTTLVFEADGQQKPYEDKLHLMQEDPAERLIALLSRLELSHQHLGVIRMEHLRKTRLMALHGGSDLNFLAELSLYGKFCEVPEYLYFRRFHTESSSWDRAEGAHANRRYYSTTSKASKLKQWRIHTMLLTSIPRSDLSPRSKWRATRFLLRKMVWARPALIRELRDVVTSPFSRRRRQEPRVLDRIQK